MTSIHWAGLSSTGDLSTRVRACARADTCAFVCAMRVCVCESSCVQTRVRMHVRVRACVTARRIPCYVRGSRLHARFEPDIGFGLAPRCKMECDRLVPS